MSDLRPTGTLVDVDGVERNVLFTLSVVNELQEKYKKPISEIINDFFENNDNLSALMKQTCEVLEVLANDEAERKKDKEREVKTGHFEECVTTKNVHDIAVLLLIEYGIDMPEPDEDTPNAESGQQNL